MHQSAINFLVPLHSYTLNTWFMQAMESPKKPSLYREKLNCYQLKKCMLLLLVLAYLVIHLNLLGFPFIQICFNFGFWFVDANQTYDLLQTQLVLHIVIKYVLHIHG